MCCSGAAWKREEVPDHKFDFVNVAEFHQTNCTTRLQYLWLYILVAKSTAVYIADIYTAIALLASNYWSGSILQSDAAQSSDTLKVPFTIGKWIFTGCIIFSFLLLAWEARKARAIIKSRDISYAFTNVMSQNWYSLRSYNHFCFFCQINNSKKKKDEFAFFVFFTFKGWKRLLLADAPRQVINGITLYSFGKAEGWTTDLSRYYGGSLIKAGILMTMLFTVVVWIGSAILLTIAALMYVPLLCYIQGNLKEYCCHKVDKRIAELMKRKNKKRLAKEAELARKEAAGDYSHLKDKKTGKYRRAPLPQPTLPKVDQYVYEEERYAASAYGGSRDDRSDVGSIRRYGTPGPAPSIVGVAPSGGAPGYPPYVAPQARYPPYGQRGVQLFDGGGHRQHPGYAESVSSADGFAGRAAPMGYGGAGYLEGGRPGLREQKSWRSEDLSTAESTPGEREEPSLLGYYGVGAGAGGEREERREPPRRQNTSNTLASQGGEYYEPPSRRALYERSKGRPGGVGGSQGESVGSFGSVGTVERIVRGDARFGSGGGGGGGGGGGDGWEDERGWYDKEDQHGHGAGRSLPMDKWEMEQEEIPDTRGQAKYYLDEPATQSWTSREGGGRR